MIDVTFSINGVDLSGKLSTYSVKYEQEEYLNVTTMDGTEHVRYRLRPTLTVSFIPMTDADAANLFSMLRQTTVLVSYTDPHQNDDREASMTATGDIEAVFGLRSVNGNRYYKGGSITLRQRTVL